MVAQVFLTNEKMLSLELPFCCNSKDTSAKDVLLFQLKYIIKYFSVARADPDCNQWITGLSGTVQSYNWPTIQLISKTHNICIRREAGKVPS